MKRCEDCIWFWEGNGFVMCVNEEVGDIPYNLDGCERYTRKWWRFWRSK